MDKKTIAGVLFYAVANCCNADYLGASKELSEVQSDINTVRSNLDQLKQQKGTVNTQLAEIEKRLGESISSLRNLEAKIHQKNQKLDAIRLEMQGYQDALAIQHKELAGQVKAAYAMGQREKLKLLLNQQDLALSSRMIAYYNYLNAARLEKLTALQKSLAQLDVLDKQEQDQAALLAEDVQKKKSEQVELAAVRKQRNELLLQLNSDFTSNEQQLIRLKEGENKLKSLMASWQDAEVDGVSDQGNAENADDDLPNINPENDGADVKVGFPKLGQSFSGLKGKLPWPAKGRFVEKFGSDDENAISDGVLINAKEGTEIRAVTGGKVVYAEWLRGYGLLTIINHGDGYMTLYAFNQSLYKHVGDSVEAGEVIASVGQSGGRSQSGLYFAIRKNGRPIDPFQWVKR